MQEEYSRFMAAVAAHSDLAATACLTPDFVATDVKGRHENANQMLARLYSRPKNGIELSTVQSAHAVGTRINIGRTLETIDTTLGRKWRPVATLTFFSDTWVDSDGAWLLERSKVDRIEKLTNGGRVLR
jgi:hypothetical protein